MYKLRTLPICLQNTSVARGNVSMNVPYNVQILNFLYYNPETYLLSSFRIPKCCLFYYTFLHPQCGKRYEYILSESTILRYFINYSIMIHTYSDYP